MKKENLWRKDKFTQVPNDLLYFLITRCNPTDKGIVGLIIRLTCGFHRIKTNHLSLDDLAKELGKDRSTISNSIKRICEQKKVIYRGDKKRGTYKYSIFDVFSKDGVSCEERKILPEERIISPEERKISSQETQDTPLPSLTHYGDVSCVKVQDSLNKVSKESLERKSLNKEKADSFNQQCLKDLIGFIKLPLSTTDKERIVRGMCSLMTVRGWCKEQKICERIIEAADGKVMPYYKRGNIRHSLPRYLDNAVRNYLDEHSEDLSGNKSH
jgi:DNA-binding transcriptional regulator GbsR (MarR family)